MFQDMPQKYWVSGKEACLWVQVINSRWKLLIRATIKKKRFYPWHLPSSVDFISTKTNYILFFRLGASEMQNKSAAGWLACFSPTLSVSPLLISSPLVPSSPSSHPSIHSCSPALCGESAVTVCPSSCGPAVWAKMGSSPPQLPSSMMSVRGPLTWGHGQLASEHISRIEPKQYGKEMFLLHFDRRNELTHYTDSKLLWLFIVISS